MKEIDASTQLFTADLPCTHVSLHPTLWSVSILGDFFGIMITCPLGSFSIVHTLVLYSTLGTFYVSFLTCPQLDKLAGYLRNLLQEASPIYQFRWTLSVATIIKRNISRNTRHGNPSLLLDPFLSLFNIQEKKKKSYSNIYLYLVSFKRERESPLPSLIQVCSMVHKLHTGYIILILDSAIGGIKR